MKDFSEETRKVFEEPPTNFKYVSDSVYIVRTQAGFESAVKHYAIDRGYSDFREIFDYLEGYPKSYPSLVSFATEYAGYHYVRARCVHINTLTKAIEESENVL